MLVLSRRKGEVLVIGDKIHVSIKELSRRRVTLAIDAPGEIRILRGELCRAMAAPRPR